MKLQSVLIAVSVALSACGGGGGNETTASPTQSPPTVAEPGDMTKYAGTWISTCVVEGQGSGRMTLVLNATGKSATGSLYADGYYGTECSGPSVRISEPFAATYMEMAGASEKLSVTDSTETSTMFATFTGNDRSMSLSDGIEAYTFTKQ